MNLGQVGAERQAPGEANTGESFPTFNYSRSDYSLATGFCSEVLQKRRRLGQREKASKAHEPGNKH